MNQTIYEDVCSQCNKPCTRVKVQVMPFGYPKIRYLTSCCQSPPIAMPVVAQKVT